MTKRKWTAVRAELLLDEANSRLESSARRLASLDQRLGVLVGASAVAGSLAAGPQTPAWTALVLALLSAAVRLGVLGSFPRRRFAELPWDNTRTELWRAKDRNATALLADRRFELVLEREEYLETHVSVVLSHLRQ